MKKATRPEEQSRPHKADSSTAATCKIARILAHLLTGASINRFEAEDLGDRCQPSTIAVLAGKRYGLIFQRQPEQVPNRWGAPCIVTRYSLLTSQYNRACAILATFTRTARATSEG